MCEGSSAKIPTISPEYASQFFHIGKIHGFCLDPIIGLVSPVLSLDLPFLKRLFRMGGSTVSWGNQNLNSIPFTEEHCKDFAASHLPQRSVLSHQCCLGGGGSNPPRSTLFQIKG